MGQNYLTKVRGMSVEMVAQVRRFNRVVTRSAGVLNENYLASGRSLGQDRLLWEIGVQGCDVRDLRSRLGLDSGYLSRLLRALQGKSRGVVEFREPGVTVPGVSLPGLGWAIA